MGQSGRSTGLAGNGSTHVWASRAVPLARTSLGPTQDIMGSADGRRTRGRTRCAVLTHYTYGDYTIGFRGFIAAVTRTAWQRPFGGAGLAGRA
jgi:hypothetical protein